MRRTGIGIDFGTTNSTAALFDGSAVRLIALENEQPILPSATYLDAALKSDTGQSAIERYIADNTGRTVELVPQVVGAAAMVVGEADPEGLKPAETVTQEVHGMPLSDAGLRGRLFRGTKRLLGDAGMSRLMVFNQPFRLVALITPILLRMRRAIAAALGRPEAELEGARIGHPVNFEGRNPERNSLALSRLEEAASYAGIQHPRFYPEPAAAALSYLHDHPDLEGEHLLTIDFGGGTLDFCVLRREGEHFEALATHGLALGGDRIDQRLFSELLFPLLGKGERWQRRGFDREIETRFPFEDYEPYLLNWPVTYMLNQNRYTAPVLDRIEQGGPAKHKFRRLRDLILLNLGYVVFQAIQRAKVELSYHEETVLDIPEMDVELRITRPEFERMIADLLEQFRSGVDEALAASGVAAADIDLVVRTGGSSLIPAVRRSLDERFPGKVAEQDPFTSVAAGLAIADYEDLHYEGRTP